MNKRIIVAVLALLFLGVLWSTLSQLSATEQRLPPNIARIQLVVLPTQTNEPNQPQVPLPNNNPNQ